MAGTADARAGRKAAKASSSRGRRAAMEDRAVRDENRRLRERCESLKSDNASLKRELNASAVHLTNLAHAIDSSVILTLEGRSEAASSVFARYVISGEELVRSPASLQELLVALFTEISDMRNFIRRYSAVYDTEKSEATPVTGPVCTPPGPPSPLVNDIEDAAAEEGTGADTHAGERRKGRGRAQELTSAELSEAMLGSMLSSAGDTALLLAQADAAESVREDGTSRPWPERDAEPPAGAGKPHVCGVIDADPGCTSVIHYCHECQKATVHDVQGICAHSEVSCIRGRIAEKYLVRGRVIRCRECGQRIQVSAIELPERVLITDSLAGKGKELLNAGADGGNPLRSAKAERLMQPKLAGFTRTQLEYKLDKALTEAERLAAAGSKGKRGKPYREADALRERARSVKAALIISSPGAVAVRCSLEEATLAGPDDFDYEAWAAMPLFSGSELTAGTLASMLCGLTDAGSRSAVWRILMNAGLGITRPTAVRQVNASSRAVLRPLSLAIRMTLLKDSPTVLMDETPFRVRCRRREDGRIRLSQLFTVNSCRTAAVQACYCFIAPDRSAENVVEVLREAGGQLTCLTTDQYGGYFSALETLAEDGIHIRHSSCLTHLRRSVHHRLADSLLLPLYRRLMTERNATGTSFAGLLASDHEVSSLTESDRIFLALMNVFDSIFGVDMQVMMDFGMDCRAEGFREALGAARRERSTVLLNVMHDLVRRFVALYPHLFKATRSADGKIRIEGSSTSRDAKAIVYLLNAERGGDLRRFTENPDVELCQSVCERSLRTAVIARKKFLFLNGADGCGAYGDLLTVANTCRLNNIDPYRYLIWYLVRLQGRIHERGARHPDPTLYRLPSRQKITGNDGKSVTIGIYDSRNRIFNDGLDLTGLAPWDYAEWCKGGMAA